MERNIKFLGCLNVRQFVGLLACYMVIMSLLNILVYIIAAFFTVLLDPYLDQLIHIKSPLLHMILLVLFISALYIKAQTFLAMYNWKQKSNLAETRESLLQAYQMYACYAHVVHWLVFLLTIAGNSIKWFLLILIWNCCWMYMDKQNRQTLGKYCKLITYAE